MLLQFYSKIPFKILHFKIPKCTTVCLHRMYQHYRLARSRYIIYKLISVQLESSPQAGSSLRSRRLQNIHLGSDFSLSQLYSLAPLSFTSDTSRSGLENVRWIINIKDPNTPCTLTTFTLLKDQRDVTFVTTTKYFMSCK